MGYLRQIILWEKKTLFENKRRAAEAAPENLSKI
jgi:hypothetical protein